VLERFFIHVFRAGPISHLQLAECVGIDLADSQFSLRAGWPADCLADSCRRKKTAAGVEKKAKRRMDADVSNRYFSDGLAALHKQFFCLFRIRAVPVSVGLGDAAFHRELIICAAADYTDTEHGVASASGR